MLFVVANVIVKFIINARFYHYQLYKRIKKKRKYTCANRTCVDVSDITPGSVDIEINELKDNLIRIKIITFFKRRVSIIYDFFQVNGKMS